MNNTKKIKIQIQHKSKFLRALEYFGIIKKITLSIEVTGDEIEIYSFINYLKLIDIYSSQSKLEIQDMIDKAVAEENFEEACRLRDLLQNKKN